MKRVGILTGGGDCPGLNAAIRAITKRGHQLGFEVVGIKDGWKGLIEVNSEVLTEDRVSGILALGGTILGSSRTNPVKIENGLERVIKNCKKLNLDALIVIGGEDTLGVANKLSQMNFPIIGIPKTIDNDVEGTDFCIGFHTAVQRAMERIDELHSTTESHHRVMVIEVMGRHFGWIATYAGLAGGADYILIPEQEINIQNVLKTIQSRYERGKNFSIVVVAEGASINIEPPKMASILAEIIKEKTGIEIDSKEIEKRFGKEKKNKQLITKDSELDAFGHIKLGGVGELLAKLIKKELDLDARSTNLGHILRGGPPTAFDRILASRFGVEAIKLVKEKEFGKMLALKGNNITSVPLKKAASKKRVNKDVYETAEFFFY